MRSLLHSLSAIESSWWSSLSHRSSMGLDRSLVRDSIVGFRFRSCQRTSTIASSILERPTDIFASPYSTCLKVSYKQADPFASLNDGLTFPLSVPDNLVTARSTFGSTFILARSAALVLHVDIAFILLPICRGFVSRLRRSTLNELVPFEKNIEFRKSGIDSHSLDLEGGG